MSRKLLVLLALSLVVVIVAYWVWGREFDWSLFLSSLKTVKPGWFAASIAATMGTYWFRAARWQVLLAPLKPIGLPSLFSITLMGFSAIFMLGRAAELARPIWLARREKVALTGSVATIVVERFLDALMLILAFGLAMLIADVPGASSPLVALLKKAAWGIAAIAGAALISLFILRSNASWVVGKIPFRRVASWMESFLQGLSFLQNGRSLGLVFIQSVCLWILIAMQFWFMLLGMNFSLSAASATLVMVAAGVGSIAQIPAIGGGFQAGYIVCMTAFFHVPKEQAVATSLVAAFISFVPTIVISFLFMAAQGFSLRELKTSLK
jgi:glycosyltransferase 2 family protein